MPGAAMAPDPLWTPIIGHYDEARLDRARIQAHVAQLRPYVRQFLIGGTTGDGWQLDQALLGQWLDLIADPGLFDADHVVLVGAFGATTDEVIERARFIEERLDARPAAATFAGLTLCPPVDADASQDAIARHFEAVLAATSSPVAIYQLPQVTGCEIAPRTFAHLAAAQPRIRYFKDTSGEDRVAWAGLPTNGVRLLRGAEGHYAQQLRPAGPYHGWLLSTGNGLASELREIADLTAQGRMEQARCLSDRLAALVAELFALATPFGGNAFADANRAADHLQAYGPAWASAPPPRRLDGSLLPFDLIAGAERALNAAGIRPACYLA